MDNSIETNIVCSGLLAAGFFLSQLKVFILCLKKRYKNSYDFTHSLNVYGEPSCSVLPMGAHLFAFVLRINLMCEFLEQSICTRASLLVSGAEIQTIELWKSFSLIFFSGFQVSFPIEGIGFFFFFDSDFYKKLLFLWLNLSSSNKEISLCITWQIGRMHCLSLFLGGRMDFNRSQVSFWYSSPILKFQYIV